MINDLGYFKASVKTVDAISNKFKKDAKLEKVTFPGEKPQNVKLESSSDHIADLSNNFERGHALSAGKKNSKIENFILSLMVGYFLLIMEKKSDQRRTLISHF